MRPPHTIVGCLSSLTLFLSSSSASLGYFLPAVAGTKATVQVAQMPDRQAVLNVTDVHSSSRRVQEGFDAAISSGEVEQAFKRWMDFMPSEFADQLREPSQLSYFAGLLKPFGQWRSYELLGTITLTSSEVPVRSQIIYVKLSTEKIPIFWEFVLIESPDGWEIYNIHFESDQNRLGFDSKEFRPLKGKFGAFKGENRIISVLLV